MWEEARLNMQTPHRKVGAEIQTPNHRAGTNNVQTIRDSTSTLKYCCEKKHTKKLPTPKQIRTQRQGNTVCIAIIDLLMLPELKSCKVLTSEREVVWTRKICVILRHIFTLYISGWIWYFRVAETYDEWFHWSTGKKTDIGEPVFFPLFSINYWTGQLYKKEKSCKEHWKGG